MEENIIQINGWIMIYVNVSVKTSCMWKKIMLGILLHATENGKYLASVIDDLVIACHEVIESCIEDLKAKLHKEKIFNEKKETCKTQRFFVLLEFFQLL